MAAKMPTPSAEILQRYVLGQLPPEGAKAVENYLSRSGAHLPVLDTLKGHDTLVEAVRAGVANHPIPDRQGMAQHIERLKQLRPAASTVGFKAGHDTAPSAAAAAGESWQELRSIVTPSQGAGEIGRLGSYRLLKVLGSGGMGVVFQAEDTQLQRMVALKVMKPSQADKANSRERFLREARAAAAIQHDHIVTIYQVGEDQSVPYLAMEYLESMTLSQWMKRSQRMRAAQILRIGRETACGLAAAHTRGLIHRDIKPSNLWLDKAKGGRIKILDFGLARPIDDDVHLTEQGAIIGTPAYMAPEQAKGAAVDSRCDLFSLGAVLYHLCTGQLPFQGVNTVDQLIALATQTPAPVRELNPYLPRELGGLVMKLLSRDPAQRLPSANVLVEVLQKVERTVAKETPVRAVPVSTPSTATTKTVASTAVPASAMARTEQLAKAQPATTAVLPNVKAFARRRWYVLAGAAIALVGFFMMVPVGLLLFSGTFGNPNAENELRKSPLDSLQRASIPAFEVAAAGLRGSKKAAKELVAVLGNSTDKPWVAMRAMAFSPDGKFLAVNGKNSSINVWNTQKGTVAFSLKGHTYLVQDLVFSPNGRQIASASSDKTIRLCDARNGREAFTLTEHTLDVLAVAFSWDSRRLASGSQDSTVKKWDTETGRLVTNTLVREGHGILSVGFSPDNRQLACGGGPFIEVIDAKTGQKAITLSLVGRITVNNLAFTSDGGRLITGRSNVEIWDIWKGKVVRTLPGHNGRVGSLALTSDQKMLASVSEDNRVILWHMASGKVIHEWPFPWRVYCVAFAPDGRHLAIGNDNGTIYIFRLTALLKKWRGEKGK